MAKHSTFFYSFCHWRNHCHYCVQDYQRKVCGKKHPYFKAIGKGLLERFMLLIGLANGIQAIITLFGAIKIGTRLKDSNDNKITNDYFMVGNFFSVTIALFEFLLYNYLNN